MIRSHLRARKHGQSIIMFAVMLAAFLALMSLGIDLVNMYAQRRLAQAVADMAVIGGAVELDGTPDGATNADTVARAIIAANGYTEGTAAGRATLCINPYYDKNDASKRCPNVNPGGSAALEVTIRYHAPTMFATTMGHTTTTVLGRAVATRRGINEYAVYANNSTTCGTHEGARLQAGSGSDPPTINGRVHSNADLGLASAWELNGSVTYDGASGCDLDDSNPAVPINVGTQTWPLSSTVRDITQYPCNWTKDGAVTGTVYANDPSISPGQFRLSDNGPGTCAAGAACSWWADAGKTQLKSGIYCTNSGDLRLTGLASGARSGTVTFVTNTGSITVNQDLFTLYPYKNNVLMFNQANTSNTAISAGGGGVPWEGWIYAQLGGIRMTGGGGLTLTGGLFGDSVELTGSGWDLLGTGPNSGFAGQLTE